jgi:outer membrane protein OmpA-like peptidoglycan-associated protein
MLQRVLTIAFAALVWAVPAVAQQRGTVELGGFGSAASFDKSLTLNTAYGGGGRIGIFLDPRWSVEFESAEMRATRTLGLRDVNVGVLSSRLTAVPIKTGALSILLGAGAGIGTETNFMHTYGLNGLIGAKIALSNSAALRVDGVMDWLANNRWKSFKTVHVGLSLYRHPNVRLTTHTMMLAVPAGPMALQRADSVNADEQSRLRRVEADYHQLRDSLARHDVSARLQSSASALATMEEKIHFATDNAELSLQARTILESKIAVFRANPGMRIIIIGNTDERATDAHNMGLGRRRSDAARAYLVAHGVEATRIEVTSEGERAPTAAGTSTNAQAQNRRDEFRLLIASDYLVSPKP